jgi:hypothetical protein
LKKGNDHGMEWNGMEWNGIDGIEGKTEGKKNN